MGHCFCCHHFFELMNSGTQGENSVTPYFVRFCLSARYPLENGVTAFFCHFAAIFLAVVWRGRQTYLYMCRKRAVKKSMLICFFLAGDRLRAYCLCTHTHGGHYVGQDIGFVGVLRQRRNLRWLHLSLCLRFGWGHLMTKSQTKFLRLMIRNEINSLRTMKKESCYTRFDISRQESRIRLLWGVLQTLRVMRDLDS